MKDIDGTIAKIRSGYKNPSREEMVELADEVEHLRCAVSYLAECHASILEGLPKAISRFIRKRFVHLCTSSVSILLGRWNPPTQYRDGHHIGISVERCRKAVEAQTALEPLLPKN